MWFGVTLVYVFRSRGPLFSFQTTELIFSVVPSLKTHADPLDTNISFPLCVRFVSIEKYERLGLFCLCYINTRITRYKRLYIVRTQLAYLTVNASLLCWLINSPTLKCTRIFVLYRIGLGVSVRRLAVLSSARVCLQTLLVFVKLYEWEVNQHLDGHYNTSESRPDWPLPNWVLHI